MLLLRALVLQWAPDTLLIVNVIYSSSVEHSSIDPATYGAEINGQGL